MTNPYGYDLGAVYNAMPFTQRRMPSVPNHVSTFWLDLALALSPAYPILSSPGMDLPTCSTDFLWRGAWLRDARCSLHFSDGQAMSMMPQAEAHKVWAPARLDIYIYIMSSYD